jgi:hypothetical protein
MLILVAPVGIEPTPADQESAARPSSYKAIKNPEIRENLGIWYLCVCLNLNNKILVRILFPGTFLIIFIQY